MTTMTEPATVVTGGVDTHRDTHVAAALDARGALLGTAEFPTTADGYHQLGRWLGAFGEIETVGVEGTGTYGRGLARHLQDAGVAVVEVDRPNRQNRRRRGKNDTIDAIAAARAAQGGDATTVAKTSEGPAEALRALQVVARGVRMERIRAISQLRALVVTAPDDLRSRLRGLPKVRLCQTVARFRIADPTASVDAANRYAMRSLGRRAEALRAEAKELKKAMAVLVEEAAPGLLDIHCVGPDTAATLVVTAGANPQRLRSEASFAKLCGSAPLDASSGRQIRHRLSRSGDRHANAAL
ncbi:MAG: transposase, partial [Actinomycetota bacterium]